jgi:hypothetical protein
VVGVASVALTAGCAINGASPGEGVSRPNNDAAASAPANPNTGQSLDPVATGTSTPAKELSKEAVLDAVGGQAEYDKILAQQMDSYASGRMGPGLTRDLQEAIDTQDPEFLASHNWSPEDIVFLLRLLTHPDFKTIPIDKATKEELRSNPNTYGFAIMGSRYIQQSTVILLWTAYEQGLGNADPSTVPQEPVRDDGTPNMVGGPIPDLARGLTDIGPQAQGTDPNSEASVLERVAILAQEASAQTQDPVIRQAIAEATETLKGNTELASRLR